MKNSLGVGSALGEKEGEKNGGRRSAIGKRSEPSGSLGREKGPPPFHFAQYTAQLAPFFYLFPLYGAWYQVT